MDNGGPACTNTSEKYKNIKQNVFVFKIRYVVIMFLYCIYAKFYNCLKSAKGGQIFIEFV